MPLQDVGALATYIPTIYTKELIIETENNLLLAPLVDRSFDKYAAGGGNKIKVPTLSNLEATPFTGTVDLTRTQESEVEIDLDQKYHAAYGVDDFVRVQDAIDYFNKGKAKAAEAIARKMDSTIADLIFDFTQTVGTVGTALTQAAFIEGVEIMNSANVPQTNRVWVLDPASITDLTNCDWFVRMDYVEGSVSAKGFTGRQILGAPVYMTTNLSVKGGAHSAGYFHKEALAFVVQMKPNATIERFGENLANVVVQKALWGVKTMRDEFGVLINTRS